MLPLILFVLVFLSYGGERVLVVERERGSVAVIEEGKLVDRLENLGDMTHGVVKSKEGKAYILSRDGVISLADPLKAKVIKKVKVAESSVGFTFCKDRVVVANYEPGSLTFLSQDLRILQKIPLGSRAVGIKSRNGVLAVSLMDSRAILLLDCERGKILRRFNSIGGMPFDALLAGDLYIAGIFDAPELAVLNLSFKNLKRVSIKAEARSLPLKVPHFGLWGVFGKTAYIPALGERKIYTFNLETLRIESSLPLPGMPVFAVISPDGKYIAVNYSGEKEGYITLLNRKTLSVIKSRKVGRRITHLRFSQTARVLYISSYYENEVKALEVPSLKVLWSVGVATPSGIFLLEGDDG